MNKWEIVFQFPEIIYLTTAFLTEQKGKRKLFSLISKDNFAFFYMLWSLLEVSLDQNEDIRSFAVDLYLCVKP